MKIQQRTRILGLVQELAEGASLSVVLERRKMTHMQALRILRHPGAQGLMRVLGELQGLQKHLILERSGPLAAAVLCRHIDDQNKSDLQFKSAVSLLQLAAKRCAAPAMPLPSEAGGDRGPSLSEDEVRAALLQMAEEARERDRQQFAS